MYFKLILLTLFSAVLHVATIPTEEPIKVLEETQHCLEKLIKNASEAIYEKTTKYEACGRNKTNIELNLAIQLKTQMVNTPTYRAYIQQHQQCPGQGVVTGAKRRRRRSIELPGLPAGTKSRKLFCIGKKNVNKNTKTFNMCSECVHSLTLPILYFPRYHKVVTCDNDGDYSCLSGDGVCIANKAFTTVLYDSKEVGFKRLNQWTPVQLEIPKSCSCELLQNTLLSLFL